MRGPLLPLVALLLLGIGLPAAASALDARLGRVPLLVACDGREGVILVDGSRALVVHNWTHSVEGTPIVEVFKLRGGHLVLDEAWAKSSGAGHPYSYEELGGHYLQVRGGWLVYDADYDIGPRLDIEGYRRYWAEVLVEEGGRVVWACRGFVNATVQVLG